MKRNKPIWKHRKPGTQDRRRRRTPAYYGDYARRAETWNLYVPQSVVGTNPRTFDMTGARPAGLDGKPDDPTYAPGVYRWKLDRGGRSVMVYAGVFWWVKEVVPSGDVWYVFQAKGKCTRPSCPLTHYVCEVIDFTLARHTPGNCPLGIPLDGSWKFVRRTEA